MFAPYGDAVIDAHVPAYFCTGTYRYVGNVRQEQAGGDGCIGRDVVGKAVLAPDTQSVCAAPAFANKQLIDAQPCDTGKKRPRPHTFVQLHQTSK